MTILQITFDDNFSSQNWIEIIKYGEIHKNFIHSNQNRVFWTRISTTRFVLFPDSTPVINKALQASATDNDFE